MVPVSVTLHVMSVAEEWRWCQLMIVMICAPQTVSAYNLVGITYVRFLAVKKPLHVKEVRQVVCYCRYVVSRGRRCIQENV